MPGKRPPRSVQTVWIHRSRADRVVGALVVVELRGERHVTDVAVVLRSCRDALLVATAVVEYGPAAGHPSKTKFTLIRRATRPAGGTSRRRRRSRRGRRPRR